MLLVERHNLNSNLSESLNLSCPFSKSEGSSLVASGSSITHKGIVGCGCLIIEKRSWFDHKDSFGVQVFQHFNDKY